MELRNNSVDGKQLASAIAWMGFGLVGSAYILFFSLFTGSLAVMLSPSALLTWFLPSILPTLFVAASVLLNRALDIPTIFDQTHQCEGGSRPISAVQLSDAHPKAAAWRSKAWLSRPPMPPMIRLAFKWGQELLTDAQGVLTEPTEYLVSVSVRLQGPELDPDLVTTAVGISPTHSLGRATGL